MIIDKRFITKMAKTINLSLGLRLTDEELKPIIESIDIEELRRKKLRQTLENMRREANRVTKEFKKEKCEVCGSKKRLKAHHIIPLPIGDNSSFNIRTLCPSCHRKTHGELKREVGII